MQIIEHKTKKFMAKFDRYEPLIRDHTATSVYDICERKYFYRMVLGRVSRSETYKVVTDFGSMYHKYRQTLEQEYKKHGEMESAHKVAILHAIEHKADCDPNFKFAYLDTTRAITTCKAAFKIWCDEKRMGRIEVLEIEQPFNVIIEDEERNFPIGGRKDQIVKWNGKLWIRDFKTTSKDERFYDRQLDPGEQATRYIYGGGKLHGSRIEGIIFDVVFNTKTAGPKFFVKLISKTTYQLETWEREQKFLEKQLEQCRITDIWPMRTHNCSFCDFADVCRSPNEESMMAKLSQNYALKPWDSTKVEQEEI